MLLQHKLKRNEYTHDSLGPIYLPPLASGGAAADSQVAVKLQAMHKCNVTAAPLANKLHVRVLDFEIVQDDSTEMKWCKIFNLLLALLSCSASEHCDADNAKCDTNNDVVDCSRRIRLRDLGN